MKPKNPTRNTKCNTCNQKLGEKKAINCQLCIHWVCLPCTGVSAALYDFCRDNEEAMAFLCQDCRLEIPQLREMKSIKLKLTDIEKDLAAIQTTVAETNTTLEELTETQTLQGQEVEKHEKDLTEALDRIKALEAALSPEATEDTEAPENETWADRFRRTKSSVNLKTMVRSEINEQSEIEKLKLNLVISGMKETNDEEVDKTDVIALIEQELNITADINKVQRIGKPRIQKPGEELPPPRLLKLQFVTQRSRKEVLSKVTNLRQSTDNHIKTQVYIRPDLTHAQLVESKNLRDLLKTTRENNPNKVYKIHRNKITEITPTQQPAAEQPAEPAPETINPES